MMNAASRLKARPDVVSSDLADGAALLDLRSSMYFSVNPVGRFMWDVMQQPASIDDIAGRVAAEFGVPLERCRPDVEAMVRHLLEHDLVETVDV